MTTEFRVSGVCERDIDLLLLEELAASQDFLQWFVQRTTRLHGTCELLRIGRSITQSNGESDLELLLRFEHGDKHKILIENKVDASFQKDQAARYAERSANYLDRDELRTCTTVLIAPDDYLAGCSETEFDETLSYESIVDWLENNDPSLRTAYKVYLLKTAIEKAHVGYNMIEDQSVTKFWKGYWQVASRVTPELEMPHPGGKPATSSFIHFRPLNRPAGTHIIHKCCSGAIDLQLNGLGRRVGEVASRLEPCLEEGMQVVRTQKSAAVRIQQEIIDFAKPFDQSAQAAERGMRAAVHLLYWAREHNEALQSVMAEGSEGETGP
ncbi:PD-(D/E)XK nuclease family protein [Mucisphaera calidilacus]|uniref:PD-(D/E)XK nuclease superfamily protein n=1 Tax=Mucisphaera calidilacus TaxID=2527982 RepID=A0A518C083_9BACT|nr:PD-(D/E)XK nuclease family protein [Mucisphaera calidilacus]QDU72628.1 hypothetical protein Pan265_25000 [Mucisphaera calidilacus]